MVDQVARGTRHASEVRIVSEITRTKKSCNVCLSHVRETFACVKACEVILLFTPSVAYKGIAISCKRVLDSILVVLQIYHDEQLGSHPS